MEVKEMTEEEIFNKIADMISERFS
ncbi:acyl carrier protein, partial [Lactobacillus gasseri]